MQNLSLNTLVRPDALAREGAQHGGLIPLSQLERFAASVEGSAPLEVSLHFSRDIEGMVIRTQIKAECQLLCQSCLSEYNQTIESSASYRPVYTLEQARELSLDDEPVLYENGFINIINMIEDEALLALPNYPRCKGCNFDNKADTFVSQFATIANSDLVPEHN